MQWAVMERRRNRLPRMSAREWPKVSASWQPERQPASSPHSLQSSLSACSGPGNGGGEWAEPRVSSPGEKTADQMETTAVTSSRPIIAASTDPFPEANLKGTYRSNEL